MFEYNTYMQDKQKTQKEIINASKWRYATKVFDPSKKLEESDLQTILESGRLSPSSLGLEPWKFFVVKDPEIRKKIFDASKQQKVLDASTLIVITASTNIDQLINERIFRTAEIQNQKAEELSAYRLFLENSTQGKGPDTLLPWLRAQTYIPLGTMILTASLLGVDSGPMEGFDNKKVDEIFGLNEQNLTAVTMLALGTRGEDLQVLRPKVRRTHEEVVKII